MQALKGGKQLTFLLNYDEYEPQQPACHDISEDVLVVGIFGGSQQLIIGLKTCSTRGKSLWF